jgi:fructokinase
MPSTRQQVVVGLGEVLWDCFADSRRPGGAPANVAFHASQLGHPGIICSRVGHDDLGRELRNHFADRGLDTRHLQEDNEYPTGRVTVDTTHPDRPSYVIHEDVAWDNLEYNSELERLMNGASAVCFGTLAQRNDRSRETIHRALSAAGEALIVYDVNLRQSWFHRDWIERSLHAARIVKLNSDELVALAGLLETGSADPSTFAHALRRRFAVDITCITRAEKGCLLIGPDVLVDVFGMNVVVADAVGAGDAFTAALMSGCLRGWPLRTAGEFANQVGALVAQRSGAMPLIADELSALIAQVERDNVS